MAIIRWQTPFDDMDRLRREVNRVFGEFTAGGEPFTSRTYPAVNITEDADHYYVRGELPGVRVGQLPQRLPDRGAPGAEHPGQLGFRRDLVVGLELLGRDQVLHLLHDGNLGHR